MIDYSEQRYVVAYDNFTVLLDAICNDGYTLIGPTVRDQAIVYDEIDGVDNLPKGWEDRQEASSYQIMQRGNNALFGFNLGPQSWKKFLYPPRLRLWQARKTDTGFNLEIPHNEIPLMAFIGVRSCELNAIAVQDRVLLDDRSFAPDYAVRRKNVFVIAAQCTQAGYTCFCSSMGTGPRAKTGFDLALTELMDEQRHDFIFEVGSDAGAAILDRTPHRTASEAEWRQAQQASNQATEQMGRQLDTTNIRELLYRNVENSRWDDVAQRCLACTNCTMVCPTCFCTAIEDVTDLAGETAERLQRWDSCFNRQFSYIHGGAVRQTIKSRYRQWLTHKLASWYDQFNMSGCVGCGRCITWCPVGIDITEEISAIRAGDISNTSERPD